MEVKPEDENISSSADTTSGFSFMASSVDPEVSDAEPVSGFSFLAPGAGEAADPTPEESAPEVSGFSFLASPSTDEHVESNVDTTAATGSGFSFLNASSGPVEESAVPPAVEVQTAVPVPNFLTSDNQGQSGEIKLGKVAAAKTVISHRPILFVVIIIHTVR